MMARIWALLNVLKKRMEIKFFFIFFVLLFLYFSSYPQEHTNEISILFYNVENLFDTSNNPNTSDDEFTPGGERHWTKYRYEEKLLNISKAIVNASGWSAPDIVAMCEIENRYVLEDLISKTPLKNTPYKIIHKESADLRGIDVALLYNSKYIHPVKYSFYPLIDGGVKINTREILYFQCEIAGIDTVHIFVNHWPSRYEKVDCSNDFTRSN